MEQTRIPYKGDIKSGNYKLESNSNDSYLLPLSGQELFISHRNPSTRGNILIYTHSGKRYPLERQLACVLAKQNRYVVLTTNAISEYAQNADYIINGLSPNFGAELLDRYGHESNGNGKIIKMIDDIFKNYGYKGGQTLEEIARNIGHELSRRLEASAHS